MTRTCEVPKAVNGDVTGDLVTRWHDPLKDRDPSKDQKGGCVIQVGNQLQVWSVVASTL